MADRVRGYPREWFTPDPEPPKPGPKPSSKPARVRRPDQVRLEERLDAVERLDREGKYPWRIAELLGMTKQAVYADLKRLRQRGRR